MNIQSYFKHLSNDNLPKIKPHKNLLNSYLNNGNKNHNESLNNM